MPVDYQIGLPLRQTYRVNYNSPQSVGLIGWWPAVAVEYGIYKDLVKRQSGAISGATRMSQILIGQVLDFDGNDYVSIPGLIGSPTTASVSAWIDYDSSDTDGASIISLGDSLGLFANIGFSINLPGGFFCTGTLWRNTTGAAVLSAGIHHLAYTFRNGRQEFYLDGKASGAATTYGANVSYNQGTTTQIGRHGNGATTWDFNGRIADVRVYNRYLSALEIWNLYKPQSRWDLYRPLERRIWFVPTGGGSTVLTVADASLALSADNIAVTQKQLLAIADAALALSSDAPALVQKYLLAVADAALALTADNVTLSVAGAVTLTVQDAALALSSDSPALTQKQLLAIADATLALAADAPALTQKQLLTVADAALSLTADNVALTQKQLLTVADASLGLTVEAPTLAQAFVLVVADATHALSADSPALIQAFVLTAADASLVLSADNITFVVAADGIVFLHLPARSTTLHLDERPMADLETLLFGSNTE